MRNKNKEKLVFKIPPKFGIDWAVLEHNFS